MDFATRYDHFIGGEYVPPATGRYFANPSPVTGAQFTEVAVGSTDDMAHARKQAKGAAARWSTTATAERAVILSEIADRIEDNLEPLAVAETWDSGRPVRETLGADLPLAADHFRYFAGAIRARQTSRAEVDGDTVVHGLRSPIGVVTQVGSWDFPLLATAWELAPALAAGNTVILKPAAQTPASVHVLLAVIADLVPPGVINIVNGYPGRTSTHRGPGIFFDDLMTADSLRSRALTGFVTGTSHALVQHGTYERFLGLAMDRMSALVVGHPLDSATTVGALVSADEREKALRYIDNAVRAGASVRTPGGAVPSGGFYVEPVVLEGDRGHDVVPAPVISVTPFNDFDDAVKSTHELPPGLGVGVWSANTGLGFRLGRALTADRVWVNNDYTYFAEAVYGHEDRHELLSRYWQYKRLTVNHA
ncbi:aldehyde dehydrogenase [Kibdelosporangium lantanae]